MPAAACAGVGRMPQRNDETLVAYLDGELDTIERLVIEEWLDSDPAARERLMVLAQSDDLVRSAYAEIVNEPVPERLIAAARGESATSKRSEGAEILFLRRQFRAMAPAPERRWQIGMAAAAGLFGLIFGGVGTYFGAGLVNPVSSAAERQLAAATSNAVWLDNAAGYYKMTVNAGDNMLIDVPAGTDT